MRTASTAPAARRASAPSKTWTRGPVLPRPLQPRFPDVAYRGQLCSLDLPGGQVLRVVGAHAADADDPYSYFFHVPFP